jgi:hypothetical protein
MKCVNCGATEGRLMGHEIPEVYDGVLAWSCLVCGASWPRFREPDRRAAASAQLALDIANRIGDPEGDER